MTVQGSAYAALAAAHQKLGAVDDAVECLQKFLAVGQDTDNRKMQVCACLCMCVLWVGVGVVVREYVSVCGCTRVCLCPCVWHVSGCAACCVLVWVGV